MEYLQPKAATGPLVFKKKAITQTGQNKWRNLKQKEDLFIVAEIKRTNKYAGTTLER